jgi:rhodanese-related sulfurtransferase
VAESKLALEVTPADVKRRMDAGEPVYLVDVREPHEYQQARIEGAELIPMRTVPAALQKLDGIADESPLIVFCHHGMRSMNVVNWLREQGVAACQSMSGGIDQWSREIDPKVPRYS